ncbi:F-box protein [Legionella waltersii]|uniref:F-box domain-containing protein n=1 Tax=Legionella waltersii TaxID=66969 RepID=A0A0W1AKG1_9GAMM|nr:F-box protein [Legionella waltersii]KTD81758.1 hypothetical protein Lwal_1010 [Legionella waltersii]SNU97123.1 Uncharacterised protein [Legionella waltersii]
MPFFKPIGRDKDASFKAKAAKPNHQRAVENKIVPKMQFKKPLTVNEGYFETLPSEIIQHVMLFLDVKTLGRLASTNSAIRDLVSQFPGEVSVKLFQSNHCGTFSELNSKYQHFLIAKNARQRELDAINGMKESIKQKKIELRGKIGPSHKYNCISQEEKALTFGFLLLGIVGGGLFSCCFPIECVVSGLIGGAVAAPVPLAVSRTKKCLCQACIECKESEMIEREANLESNFPEPSANQI